MANLQDGGGKQRHRRQMSPSPADPHDWEQIHNPALDSLPYRTRSRTTHADDNTRMPDTASRRTQHSVSSSHRSRRASEDLRESMMPPTTLNRPRAVSHSTGKALLEYEDDDETGNAPSEARGHQSRPRLKYRARSRSRSMSDSERSSSRSEFVMTPTRSARGNPSTPNSRHSSRYQSNRRSRSIDSTSDVSTQCEVKEILRRHAAEVQVVSDDEQPGQRRHRRRHRKGNSVIPEEEPTSSVRHVVPVVADGRSVPSRRHRHQSDSRSDSRRRPHQQHDRQEAIVKPFNPTRPHRKYYDSDSIYADRPKLLRSASSHVTSTHSVSTSSRRSSTVISKFVFGQTNHLSKPRLVECVACLDDGIQSTKAAKLKCKHYMCHSCMRRVFKVSIKDPQQMPPRCCTEDPIPVEHVDRLFDISFKKTWNRKFAEYSTRNRIYCPSRRCGEWIKPNRVQKLRDGRKIATCGHCKTEVCCACNGKAHRSKDCPRDDATNEILEQAKEFGWQRCFHCREMVELREGCNHMTCRCGAEFCMICGLKWKSCECPWFNYDAVEQDRLEHIAGPTSTRQERTRPPARENRRHSSRRTPRSYEEEFPQRASQERDDEDLARQLQYDDDDDDDDNDDDGEYVNGYGEIIGIGNAGGHSMNDDYRRTPRVVPAAPSPPMQAIDRANTGDYVTSVNKKRGVRASSMERRLADRFSEQRQSSSPTHHTYTMPISTPPPPPPPPLGMPGLGMTGMGPPVPLHPPGVPFMRRAHTMEEDMYGGPSHSRLSERITPGRTRREFEADTASHTPPGRRRHRERERQHEIPRDSVLAGLTGPGEGMNRVHEWRNYVTTEDPDFGEIVAH